MKTCTKCGIEKDEIEFVKNKRCKNGIENRCASCKYEINTKNGHNQKYRLRNPEKSRLSLKEWRLKNPEKQEILGIKQRLKKQIGELPPHELVEVKLLINKTKRLCKTLKS